MYQQIIKLLSDKLLLEPKEVRVILCCVWNPVATLAPVFFPHSLCKGRTLYSVVRDAKVVLDVNKTRQIAQEMVKVRQLSADPPPSRTREGKSHLTTLLSGNGLPSRQGDYTQRHEVQECLLRQWQSCHHRLWTLHHIWGVAGWQVIMVMHVWDRNILFLVRIQCRDSTEPHHWSGINALSMVKGQQNIQSSESNYAKTMSR